MPYPAPGEYQEAVQFPQTAFGDPALQAATPDVGALGLPVAITGAFAVVFSLRGRTERWAVKGFLTEVRDQAARYEAISEALAALGLPYTVLFDYQARGFLVGGRAVPLLKMDWVEGEGLNRFARRHLDRPDVLRDLAARWADLLARLDAAGIAHGDLQHGNVLVAAGGGALRLVDYDTMYVPALKGRLSPEVGHRNYQHPDRSERDFGPYLDRFSGLAIYTALRALAVRPALWARYDTGENLLFRAADFYDPAASALFAELADLPDVRLLAEALRHACFAEPDVVPTLAEVIAGDAVEVRRPARRPRPASRRDRRREAGRKRSPLERFFAPLLAAWAAVAVLLLLVGWTAAAVAVGCLGAVAAGWAAWSGYRRLPPVRRRSRLWREEAYFERLLSGLEGELATLRAERTRFLDRLDAVRAERLREVQEEALYSRLKHHFVGEAAAFEGIRHRVVVRLKAAGIRNAFHATPDRLASVREIGDVSRERVALWRAGLVAQYRDAIPDRLSPAEVRRLDRHIQHRLDALEAEAERIERKAAAQRREQAEVRERAATMPRIEPVRYLRYLLRLGALPAWQESPPAPTALPHRPPGLPGVRHDPPRREEAA